MAELLFNLNLSTLNSISAVHIIAKSICITNYQQKEGRMRKLSTSKSFLSISFIWWQICVRVAKSCAWSLLEHKFLHQRILESTSINFALARLFFEENSSSFSANMYLNSRLKAGEKSFSSSLSRMMKHGKCLHNTNFVLCCNIITDVISSWLRSDFWGSRGSSEQQPWTWMLSKHENISFSAQLQRACAALAIVVRWNNK